MDYLQKLSKQLGVPVFTLAALLYIFLQVQEIRDGLTKIELDLAVQTAEIAMLKERLGKLVDWEIAKE